MPLTSATVVLDSLSPIGERLTTMELTFPRFILAEFNTHRSFSRNAASSRAIPVEKMIAKVKAHPFVPTEWGTNQKGMQAGESLSGTAAEMCERTWLQARDIAVMHVEHLLGMGVHKQLANRLLEPFGWATVVASATEWANFFWQRCHKDAQPQFQKVAGLALKAYHESRPTEMQAGQWHTPYILPCEYHEFDLDTRMKVSVARCARVSYLAQNGLRDSSLDLELYDRLRTGNHFSPFEHVASALTHSGWDWKSSTGNFWGWNQFRKGLPDENRSRMTFEQELELLTELGL